MCDNARVTSTSRDRVDERMEMWAGAIPGLDAATEAITQRVAYVHKAFEKSLAETTEQFGVAVGEYKVLTILRGSEPDYERSPTDLAKWTNLSTGAMTNRLDNLEDQGLVERLPDPSDRRALRVKLTTKGYDLWQQMAEIQAEKELRVASVLDERERDQLNDLLRRLVLSFADK